MDGTLLNSQHEVSPLFYELYSALRDKGVLFAAASGRQYNSIVSKLAPIRDEIYVIAENGGIAMKAEKEIISTPLLMQTKNSILDALDKGKEVYPVLCTRHNAYVTDKSSKFLDVLREYYTEFTIIQDPFAYTKEVLKIAVYHFESSEKYIYPLVSQFNGSLMVKISGQHWVDISHPNANKGFALQKIQNELGILPSETLVFGDYNNDLEMMALSDFSFAMENAHPNVLNAAKYKTLSNDAFGVEKVLEALLQSKN